MNSNFPVSFIKRIDRTRLLLRLGFMLFLVSLFACMFPVWSPDGTKVAYLNENPEGEEHCLAYYDLRSATSVSLLEFPKEDRWILGSAWHPNGRDLFVVFDLDNKELEIDRINTRSKDCSVIAKFDMEVFKDEDADVISLLPIHLIEDRYLFIRLEKGYCRVDVKRKRIHEGVLNANGLYRAGGNLFYQRELDSSGKKRIQLGKMNPHTLRTKTLCEIDNSEPGILGTITSTPIMFKSDGDDNIRTIRIHKQQGQVLREINLPEFNRDFIYPFDPVPPYHNLWMLAAADPNDATKAQWWLMEVSLLDGQSRSTPIERSFYADIISEDGVFFLGSVSPKNDRMILSLYPDELHSRHLLIDMNRWGQEGWIQDITLTVDPSSTKKGA